MEQNSSIVDGNENSNGLPASNFQVASHALHNLARDGRQLQEALQKMQAELELSRTELAQANAQCNHFQAERDAMQGERDQAANQCRLALSESEKLRHECGRHLASLDALSQHLSRQTQKNNDLRHQLLEVYSDLHAEDLPTLITRVGLNLTESECGLFTGPGGEGVVASVGLDNLPPEVINGIFKFTRRAALEEDSIEINDSKALPDGSALVNIACAPVVVRGNFNRSIISC